MYHTDESVIKSAAELWNKLAPAPASTKLKEGHAVLAEKIEARGKTARLNEKGMILVTGSAHVGMLKTSGKGVIRLVTYNAGGEIVEGVSKALLKSVLTTYSDATATVSLTVKEWDNETYEQIETVKDVTPFLDIMNLLDSTTSAEAIAKIEAVEGDMVGIEFIFGYENNEADESTMRVMARILSAILREEDAATIGPDDVGYESISRSR